MRNSKIRHFAKTISWRIIGTLDTMIISWIISGDMAAGFKIGGLEIITKMILYFFHERIWFKSSLKNAVKRHIIKTISWRIIGTLDTMFLAWLITGNPVMGIKIGAAEIISKMMLYYVHEKLWYKTSFGLRKNNNNEQQYH